MTAMTAASLDVLSGGRFRLGLGVSGPQVSEGWHGVRFGRPLARTREYLAVVDRALSRKTVTFDGEHYQLPLPDGPGKPLKLTIAPVSEHIPIYLAAVGPKNLELAGELADGWLAVFYAPEFAAEQLGHVAAGRATAGRTLDGFDVVPTFPLVVGADPRACADPVRPYAALYVGGMGSREQNFYNALAVRMGFAEAAAHGPGPVPDRSAPGRDGRRAVRVHRPDLAARGPGPDRGADAGAGRLGRDHLHARPERRLGRGEAGRPRPWPRRRWTPPASVTGPGVI